MVRAASGGGKKRPVFLDFAGVESMGDDARGNRTGPAGPADDPALSVRLKRLGQRLGEVGARRPVQEGPPRSAADMSGFARGMRLSTELVAGVLVGAFLGWALDRLLGTSPWGLIVLLMLGFVAGVLNVMRSAGLASGGFPVGKERRDD
jgi:ATP synthase protein I